MIDVFFNLCSQRIGTEWLSWTFLQVWIWLSHPWVYQLLVLWRHCTWSSYHPFWCGFMFLPVDLCFLYWLLSSLNLVILTMAYQIRVNFRQHWSRMLSCLESLYCVVRSAITSLQQVSVHLNMIWAVILMVWVWQFESIQVMWINADCWSGVELNFDGLSINLWCNPYWFFLYRFLRTHHRNHRPEFPLVHNHTSQRWQWVYYQLLMTERQTFSKCPTLGQ